MNLNLHLHIFFEHLFKTCFFCFKRLNRLKRFFFKKYMFLPTLVVGNILPETILGIKSLKIKDYAVQHFSMIVRLKISDKNKLQLGFSLLLSKKFKFIRN